MSSEWLKVMLGEIARKNAEAEQARAEQARRGVEGEASRPAAGAADEARDAPPE